MCVASVSALYPNFNSLPSVERTLRGCQSLEVVGDRSVKDPARGSRPASAFCLPVVVAERPAVVGERRVG